MYFKAEGTPSLIFVVYIQFAKLSCIIVLVDSSHNTVFMIFYIVVFRIVATSECFISHNSYIIIMVLCFFGCGILDCFRLVFCIILPFISSINDHSNYPNNVLCCNVSNRAPSYQLSINNFSIRQIRHSKTCVKNIK